MTFWRGDPFLNDGLLAGARPPKKLLKYDCILQHVDLIKEHILLMAFWTGSPFCNAFLLAGTRPPQKS